MWDNLNNRKKPENRKGKKILNIHIESNTYTNGQVANNNKFYFKK